MPQPDLKISPVAAEQYGPVLRHVLPDLGGYKEIYIITEADMKRFKSTLDRQSAGLGADLLESGTFMKQLQQNDPQQYARLSGLLESLMGSPRARADRDVALPVETTGPDGEKVRAGFVFLFGAQKARIEDMGPGGLTPDQRDRLASLDDTARESREREWLVIAHESGHLVASLKEGIPPLSKRGKLSTDQKHGHEVEGDDYMLAIRDRMAAAGELQHPQIADSFMNQRTLTGVEGLMRGEFEEHFTGPFVKNAPMTGTPPETIRQAGQVLSQSVDADLVRRFGDYYQDKIAGKPRPDPSTLSRGEAVIESCLNEAIDSTHETRLYREETQKTPLKAALLGVSPERPTTFETFEGCATGSHDGRVALMRQVVGTIAPDTPAHQIGDLYLKAHEKEFPAPQVVTPPSSEKPAETRPAVSGPTPQGPAMIEP